MTWNNGIASTNYNVRHLLWRSGGFYFAIPWTEWWYHPGDGLLSSKMLWSGGERTHGTPVQYTAKWCLQYNVQRQALVMLLQRGFLEALYRCSAEVPDTGASRSQPARYLPAPPMISVPATAHNPYGRPIFLLQVWRGGYRVYQCTVWSPMYKTGLLRTQPNMLAQPNT